MTPGEEEEWFRASPIPMGYQTAVRSRRTGRADEVRILNVAAVRDMIKERGLQL